MSVSTAISLQMLIGMFLWCGFLIFDIHHHPNAPSFISSLRLFLHMTPAVVLYLTSIMTQTINDSMLIWLVALLFFRYWRTLVNIFFWFRYEPTAAPPNPKFSSSDCTVIVPTVGPEGNATFAEMMTAILVNKPSRLIFSANTDESVNEVDAVLPAILRHFKSGISTYQKELGLGPMDLCTDIRVTSTRASNKRCQVIRAFEQVDTEILVMADDTAIWHPNFLKATLPPFESEKVGLVGTRKWVKHQPRTWDTTSSFLQNVFAQYWAGFWNAMGGIYLIRHNFEIQATNAADGGVFCVSGRTSVIRTRIVNHPVFKFDFLNEYVLRIGDWFSGFGPVTADDDNFITRYVIDHGWDIKIQCSEEATITTVLGKFPKFPQQCLRWSRTTFRQNPIALFADRTIWWKWPLTVWTTYLPWMYNAALVWDGLAVFTLVNSKLYAASDHRVAFLCGLIGLIWSSKLVKTAPWFWAHPVDFFLYFLIPAYPLFAYYHSVLKIWTALTFWDLTWSGRKIQIDSGKVVVEVDR